MPRAETSLTENDLRLWAMWGPEAVLAKITTKDQRGMKVDINAAMRFRRDLQIALANYARHNKFDQVQESIIGHTKLIETTCWRAWWMREHKRRLRNDPTAQRIGPKTLKIQLRAEWEAMCRKASY